MPAEYIRGCQPIIGLPDAVEVEGLVGVVWHDDLDHVQVATLTRQTVSHETIESMYIDLDRRGINDLIRHLKRARDKAYGRDE
jgi:hypothetical protein